MKGLLTSSTASQAWIQALYRLPSSRISYCCFWAWRGKAAGGFPGPDLGGREPLGLGSGCPRLEDLSPPSA